MRIGSTINTLLYCLVIFVAVCVFAHILGHCVVDEPRGLACVSDEPRGLEIMKNASKGGGQRGSATPKVGTNSSPATPRSSCTSCKINLEKNKVKSIECDVCDAWFCIRCSKVKPAVFDEISGDDSILWTCPNCNVALPGLKKILATLAQFQDKFVKLEEKLESLASNLQGSMGHDVPSTGGKPEKAESKCSVQEAVHSAIIEEKEVEKRKLNLIIHALPEGSEENQNDNLKVKALIHDKLKCEVDFENCVRLGKPSAERSRPVRFQVHDFNSKREILKAAKSLKNDRQYSNVFITPDLTKHQREQAFHLREEKRKRERDGEQGLIIRKGRIIKSTMPRSSDHSYTRGRLREGGESSFHQ